MKHTPDLVGDVVLVTFVRPVADEGVKTYGRAILVGDRWVDVPTEEVLRRLAGMPGKLDGAAVQLTITTLLEGGLHRGRREMTTLSDAVHQTLLAHLPLDALISAEGGVDGLVTAILGAFAQAVAFVPDAPVAPPSSTAIEPVPIEVDDLAKFDGRVWRVTKVRKKKKTVDLSNGHGRRTITAKDVPLDRLEWARDSGGLDA